VRPLWFGPEERPLFGWLHTPAGGSARGGVLLCPALGIEAVGARYAYRQLADRLANEGFATLRFDYDGTGDSAGDQNEPERVTAWLRSIRIAVEAVRNLDLNRTSVIGMRMGATLAVQAVGSDIPLTDDLVLWDPCPSGRAFLRELGALGSVTLGPQAKGDGSIETPGYIFDEETVSQLSDVAISNVGGSLADGILLLTRTGRKGNRQMNERLDMPHVQQEQIAGQEELIDVDPGYAVVPETTIDTIVEWLATRSLGNSLKPIDPLSVGRTSAIVGRSEKGVAIEERAAMIGASELFSITTSPQHDEHLPASAVMAYSGIGGSWSTPPTVYFLNAGVIDHVGPARLWVQLSRSLAKAGLRSVRFDLSGLGDSSSGTYRPREYIYAPAAIDEVLSMLLELSPDDPSNVILVGLCSGGYHALEGALAEKTRGVCVVNPVLTFTPPEVRIDAPPELQDGKLDVRRRASAAKKDWTRIMPAARGVLGPLVLRLPDWTWWILNRLAVASSPVNTFRQVIDNDSDVLVLAGEREARLLCRGESSRVRQLRSTGRFRLEVIPGLEHTLLERKGRETASRILTDYLLEHYAPKV
jgi:alpha-beta hydrolase superfamily lysophospholipase